MDARVGRCSLCACLTASLVAGLWLGCVSTRDRRAEQMRAALKVLPKVPLESPDGAELRYQLAMLEIDEGEERLRRRDLEGADQYWFQAGERLDELVERRPAYPRLNAALVHRALVAMRRERFQEAVTAFRKALALGLERSDEDYVRSTFPAALRLSGDCFGTLEQPISTGRVAANVRLQRSFCRANDVNARCEELAAGVDEALDAGVAGSFAQVVRDTTNGVPASCLSRFPGLHILIAPPDAG